MAKCGIPFRFTACSDGPLNYVLIDEPNTYVLACEKHALTFQALKYLAAKGLMDQLQDATITEILDLFDYYQKQDAALNYIDLVATKAKRSK